MGSDRQAVNKIKFSVDKENQLDVTFCILYFSSNSCSTCFGQPRVHHQELTTAWLYSLVLVCAVTMRGDTQIWLTVSGLCVDMRGFFCGFIVVCRYSLVCNQIWLDNLPAAMGMYFNPITNQTIPTYNNETTKKPSHPHTAHSQWDISV